MDTPIILPPQTPSELLKYILRHHYYPTTIIIGSFKQPFLEALIYEVKAQDQTESDPLLHKTILQTAISRHIRLIFTPTVSHLRAYLSTFSKDDTSSKIKAPPTSRYIEKGKPVLFVYGFLEVHRLTTEWSAQGLMNSCAALVEAAERNEFRASILEPRGGGDGFETVEQFLGEELPVLSGTIMRESGMWNGRTVDIKRVLSRWFEIEPSV